MLKLNLLVLVERKLSAKRLQLGLLKVNLLVLFERMYP